MAKHRTLRALLLGLALFAAACAGSDDAVATEAAGSAGDSPAEEAPAADGDGDAAAETESESESESADDAMADESDATAGDESASGDATGGEDGAAPAGGPPPSLPPEEARAAAEQNIPGLQTSDDARDIEVVSVYDGSVTSLREVVTGDRPVLVWFWAPH